MLLGKLKNNGLNEAYIDLEEEKNIKEIEVYYGQLNKEVTLLKKLINLNGFQ